MTYEPCRTCGGTGHVPEYGQSEDCERCGGLGSVPHWRARCLECRHTGQHHRNGGLAVPTMCSWEPVDIGLEQSFPDGIPTAVTPGGRTLRACDCRRFQPEPECDNCHHLARHHNVGAPDNYGVCDDYVPAVQYA